MAASEARLAQAGRMLTLLGAGLGAMGLVGWLIGEPFLTTLVAGQPAMKANTALGLVLVGVSAALRYRVGAKLRRLAEAAAVVALAIALGTVAEYALQLDLGIDRLLVADPTGPFPGRPSPPTAVALGLLAAALLVFDTRLASRWRPSEWLALLAGFTSFVALLGFVFGAGPLYRLASAPVTGVALPAAVSLLLITIGMLLERPSAGVMRAVGSSSPGGTLLRHFIPAGLLAPIVLKLLVTSLLQGLGVHDESLIFAVMVAATSVLALLVLGLTAARLTREHEALVASRARVSSLVEQAPDGIFVADLEGRYREVNDAACRMLGFGRDELIGKTIVDLIPPGDVGRLWKEQQEMLTGSPQMGEWTLRRKDGALLPVEVSASILPDGRWQATARDISERKRSHEKLREVQERLDLALRGADLGTWDWNIQSGGVTFNSRWAEMRGFRLDEILPHVDTFISSMHPEDRPRVQQALDAHFQGHTAGYEAEFRARTRSGEWIWILDRGKVFERDGSGLPIRMAGIELDITPRKRAEEELRIAETKSSGILSVSADAIISIDEAQRITLFNEGAEAIFGYSRAEILGAPLETLLPQRFAATHRGFLERFAAGSAVARRMGGRQTPIFGRRKNGEEFPADAAISKLEVAGRRILTVALRDVTEERRLEEELRRAIRSRDDVLGVVAHDLRSPLSSIIIQATRMHRRGPEPDRRSRKPAEAIERAANRMNRLIQDLLDITRMEASRLSIEQAPLHAEQLVSEAVEAQRLAADAEALELRLELPHALPDVFADRDRLLQIFENLIGNALKFTPAGGRITVGAAPRDADVVFWVADTGRGVSAEQLPHLFDRFWQARGADRRGAGLGLPIVKGLVEAHGGRIWAESTPGQGSTFFFTLPLSPQAGAALDEPAAQGA
jgi:PAS domain S-box-containing protein